MKQRALVAKTSALTLADFASLVTLAFCAANAGAAEILALHRKQI